MPTSRLRCARRRPAGAEISVEALLDVLYRLECLDGQRAIRAALDATEEGRGDRLAITVEPRGPVWPLEPEVAQRRFQPALAVREIAVHLREPLQKSIGRVVVVGVGEAGRGEPAGRRRSGRVEVVTLEGPAELVRMTVPGCHRSTERNLEAADHTGQGWGEPTRVGKRETRDDNTPREVGMPSAVRGKEPGRILQLARERHAVYSTPRDLRDDAPPIGHDRPRPQPLDDVPAERTELRDESSDERPASRIILA